MSTIRAVLGIVGGFSFGYVVAVIVTGLATPRGIGLAIAITALCVIGIYAIKAVEADKRRAVDGYPVRVITPKRKKTP